MSAPAAFRAAYADFKVIRTRRQAQIIVEVPLEMADAALAALGGLPQPDREVWLAIARLDAPMLPAPAAEPPGPVKDRRAFCDLPMSAQAAIKSNDPAFARWLGGGLGDECAAKIRSLCGVSSRSLIVAGSPAGDLWQSLLREFEGGR